jgi:hypothetical protein
LPIDEKFKPYVKVFPATELPPYGEPVSPDNMEVGRVYFALQYLDRDLFVPTLEPFIFLGLDLDGESSNGRYFHHFDSYRAGVRYENHSAEESECFQVYAPNEGKHIFDYEHALRLLMRCALLRREMADVDERIVRSADDSSAGSSVP